MGVGEISAFGRADFGSALVAYACVIIPGGWLWVQFESPEKTLFSTTELVYGRCHPQFVAGPAFNNSTGDVVVDDVHKKALPDGPRDINVVGALDSSIERGRQKGEAKTVPVRTVEVKYLPRRALFLTRKGDG